MYSSLRNRYGTTADFGYSSIYVIFGFHAPKDFKIIWLSNILALSVTWWRLFQKRVVRTKLDIYVFITWNTIQSEVWYIRRYNFIANYLTLINYSEDAHSVLLCQRKRIRTIESKTSQDIEFSVFILIKETTLIDKN